MNKVLLREFNSLCPDNLCTDLLTESEKVFVKNGGMILTGLLQRADVKNGNGRIYPYNVLLREVENYKKIVKENRALGELDHSENTVIELKNASHMITEVWMDGKDVMGKIKLLETPSGNIAKGLIKSGVTLGISSRGLGSVTETKNGTMVGDDFQLVCWDLVTDPSTFGAFMRLSESKQYDKHLTKSDRINRAINDILF